MLKQWDSQNERILYDGVLIIWREGDLVYKQNSARLGPDWKEKMEKIVDLWEPPSFVSFIENGYVTKYIEGTDLHGNKPFCIDHSSEDCILIREEKQKVLEIFESVSNVGKALGYTLGDITCGNILIKDGRLYLIDYDVVVQYPLDATYATVWNNTERIIGL